MLLFLACAPAPDDTGLAPAYFPPDAPGPHLVGTAESTFVGPGGDTRVQVWFPAADAAESLYAYEDLVEGAAREGAVPACDAARPVAVFSHGNRGIRFQSIFLTEHLASHGWVVVAPEHPGNSFFDGSAPLSELLLRRPADAIATFDWLADTDADGLLAGCVDPADGYAMIGHSFGGYTTLAVAGATLDADASAAYCAGASGTWLCDDFATAMADAGERTVNLGDPRAWAAVPMAPAGYEVLVGGLADIALPTLVLGGSLDEITSMAAQVSPIYGDLVVTPRALGTLEGAGHYAFSDACSILPTYDDCAPPYLPEEDTHPVIRTAVTAFLHRVRGDEQAAAWLPDPAATILAWEAAE
jgi:predicted dienelactone hydrolase